MSILHYCMWAQQLIRMVHLGVSLNHYQYIDQNGIVNGAYLYSTILCSSLNQETFWTVLLVMSCGITITSSDATKVQRYFIAVSMFFFIRGQRHASNGLRIQGRMVFIFNYVYVGYNDDFVLEFEDDANVENSIRAISPFRGFGRRN